MPVSTTTKPVTHTADVDVNKATNGLVQPWLELMGSISKIAPRIITARKPITSLRAGSSGCAF